MGGVLVWKLQQPRHTDLLEQWAKFWVERVEEQVPPVLLDFSMLLEDLA
jgi:hypothetical protein